MNNCEIIKHLENKNPDAFYYTKFNQEKEKMIMRTLKQNDTENRKTEVCMTKDQMIELMKKLNKGRTDNLKSRENALRTLIGGLQVDDKVFVSVPIEDLHIDDSYQRPEQSHVKIIAKEWESMKYDPLKINYREDGNFYVWDGQHRLAAMKIRGAHSALCAISVGLSKEMEADFFGSQGNGIKKPNLYDIYKSNVCKGKELDVKIKNVCDEYNVEIKKSNNPRMISCLSLVYRIFRQNHEDYFRWILDLLDDATWYNFNKGYCHDIIWALYEIRLLCKDDSEYVKNRLSKYMKKISPNDLITKSVARYPQYRDEPKSLKMFLIDIINEDGNKSIA